jgi:REP element-mobilizing transposase RayT
MNLDPFEAQGKLRRRALPHWERDGGIYFVTFCLYGVWNARILHEQAWSTSGKQVGDIADWERHEPVEALDYDPRHLENPKAAEMVVNAVRFFAGSRYNLFAYVVMPNHAHLVFQPLPESPGKSCWPLDRLMHSLKSFTAHEAVKILGVHAPFWQREYYDRLLRDEDEFAHAVEYTLMNPVAAGLCEHPLD